MKVFLLLITLMFSASVLADCCNFEIETDAEHSQVMGDGDHCNDSSDEHSEAESCHCSPVCQIRILTTHVHAISFPTSYPIELFFTRDSLSVSFFESSIFHPPIA